MKPELPRHVFVAAIAFGLNALWAVALLSESARDSALVVPLAILLLTAAPIAWGLLRISRAFFIFALIHSVAILTIGLATARFVEKTGWMVVASMVQSAVVVLFLLRPNIRAPFLRQRQGFRRFDRFEANLKVALEFTSSEGVFTRTGETFDISRGGTYVVVDTAGLSPDMRVKANIELREGKNIRLPARLTNVSLEGHGPKPAGIGIEFSSLTRDDRRILDDFIGGGRHHERVSVTLPIHFDRMGATVDAETFDVSLSGCYVRGSHDGCAPGDRLSIILMLHDGDPLELLGEVMWLSLTEAKGKPPGLAIHFSDLSRADKRRLSERLKEAGVEPN